MLIREMKAEFVLIILNRLERGQFHIGVGGKSARIEAPCVIARLAMNNLLRQQPAVPAAFAKSGPQAYDTKRISLAGDRADQGRAVNRIGDGAIHDTLDPDLCQRGHAGECALEHIHDAVQIVGAKVVGKGGVNPIHPPRFAVLFVEANQQTILFLTAVIVADRTAQQRHAVTCVDDRGDVLGDEILVLHRRDRVMHTHHRADLVHAVAAGVNDDLGFNVAFVGVDNPAIVGPLGQPRDRRLAIDLGPCLARVKGQRLTKLRGVDVAILSIPETANQVVGGDQRMAAGAFGGVDDLEMHAHPPRH